MMPSQTSFCFTKRCMLFPRKRSVHLAAAILSSGALTCFCPSMAEAASMENGLQATPLVLKDGRIAQVSIHKIPFPEDAAAMSSKTEEELEQFTRALATDCFLTAQVIGHVDKSETNGRDTVDIHRLARSRADTIQEALIANGLPAASIASVWDWQFMQQDAKATLWVFQLAEGDDCSNEPLTAAADEMVASSDRDDVVRPLPKQMDVQQKEEAAEPVEPSIVAASRLEQPEVATPAPAAKPKETLSEEAEAQIKTALAPSPSSAEKSLVKASKPADPVVDKKGRVVVSDSGRLEITFATNSSYIPNGWSKQLKSFLEHLDEGKSYAVRLETSIDGGGQVAGTSSEDEAARYNRWLAERRSERVKDWLMKNSKGSTIKIENSELTNDGSRRVTVELSPLG